MRPLLHLSWLVLCLSVVAAGQIAPLDIEGIPEVLVYDHMDGTSTTVVQLRTADGGVVALKGVTPESVGTCGARIRVRGKGADGGPVTVREIRLAATGAPSAALIPCSPTGAQKIALVLVHFPGATPTTPTAPEARSRLFESTTSVKAYVEEASYGRATVSGDVYGPYVLDRVYGCTETDAMRARVVQQLQATIPFRQYNRLIIVFPNPVGGCSYGGLGTIGCVNLGTLLGLPPTDWSVGTAWIRNDQLYSTLTSHEVGHTLGLQHANSLDFGTEPLGDLGVAGNETEYGDPISVMGSSSNYGHFTAPQKVQLGWITAAEVQLVESAGTYTIAPIEAATASSPRALKVRRITGSEYFLWLEHRQPLGLFDTQIPATLASGAWIRYSTPAAPERGFALDFTPGSRTDDFLDGALAIGTSWVDPYTNRTIRVLSGTTSGLTVQIGDDPCLTVTPASRSVTGETQSLTVAVSATAGCKWTAVPSADWITLTTAATVTGSATLGYRLSTNPGATARTGFITLRGVRHTITQAGGGASAPLFELFQSSVRNPAQIYLTGTFSDLNGAADIRRLQVLVNGSYTRAGGCFMEVDRTAGTVALGNDAGTGWAGAGPVLLANAATLNNAACELVSVSVYDASATQVYLEVVANFRDPLQGRRNVYLIARDSAGLETPPEVRGQLTLVVNRDPEVVSLSPSSGGGIRPTFVLTARDANGSGDITSVSLTVNSSALCRITADRGKITLDTTGATATYGAATALDGNGCSVDASGASWVESGNTVTVTLPLTFKAAAAGARTLFAEVAASGSSPMARSFGPWQVNAAGCLWTVTPQIIGAPAAAATYPLTVTAPAGCAWAASTNTAWLTANTGTGSGTLNLATAQNTGSTTRNGTLTVGGMAFPFNQAGTTCGTTTLAPSSVNIAATGGSGTVSVTGGCPWLAVSGVAWLKVVGAPSALSVGSLQWAVDENAGAARSTTLTVAGQTVTFQQAATNGTCAYVVAPAAVSLVGSTTTGIVTVSTGAGCPWSAGSAATWLTFPDGNRRIGPGTLTFQANTNTGAERSADLFVAGQRIPVTQAAGCAYTLSPARLDNVGAGGQTATITMTGTACAWESKSNANWVQPSPGTGTGPGTVRVTVFPNFSSTFRSAVVQIAGLNLQVGQLAASGTFNERMVGQIYFNFLGRVATPAEIAFQLSEGLNKGLSREALAMNFFNSAEFNAGGRFAAGLYVGLLNRDAEYDGWLFQRNAVVTLGIPQLDLVTNFVNSAEFILQHPGIDNAEFVRVLYRQVLLREPSVAEVALQASALAAGTSRAQLSTNLVRSLEFEIGTGSRLTSFLLSACLLQRDVTAYEMSRRSQDLSGGVPVINLVREIVYGAEFEGIFTK